jgi:uncharacterized protein (DUF697 family)
MPRRPKSKVEPNPSVLARLLQSGLRKGLTRAYHGVQLDPAKYLETMRRAHRLPISTWSDMFRVEEDVVKHHADRIIRSASRAAALEGTGLGLGGMLTILPDAGILSAITVRMLHRLSLIYGFEYNTEDETQELWLAAASAAGLDMGREFIGKQAATHLVPAIIDRMAVKLGAEVAEKWTGRVIPLISAAAAGTLNYYFVRSWGRRAQKHFHDRHMAVRKRSLREPRYLAMAHATHLNRAN